MGDNLTLYLAAQEEQQKLLLCTDEDGVIDTDRFDAITENFEERVTAVIAVIKSIRAKRAAIAAEIKALIAPLDKQLERIEHSEDRLEGYLQKCLTMARSPSDKKFEVKSLDGMHLARLHKERDVKVVVESGAKLSEEYLLPAREREPNKMALKAALEDGAKIEGARLEKNDRLEIK